MSYRRWFRLPARRRDVLQTRNPDYTASVALSSTGFDIPPGARLPGRTVLLELTVTAALAGRLREPLIEFQWEGAAAHRQYFERAAAGQRYLNLSALFAGEGRGVAQRILLRGRGLHWAAQGRLLVFEPPPLQEATILVLAPHPDDAEIAAFGVYASRKSWITTLTAGERGTGMVSSLPAEEQSRWTALLRVWDSLSVPQLGEIPAERLVNLVCPDGALQSMFREPARGFSLACEAQLSRTQLRARNRLPQFQQAIAGCTWEDLVTELQRVLQLSQPDIIVCPHPQAETHPDHVFTTVALEHALQRIGGKRPLLLLYTVHGPGSPAHPFGPADAVVGPSPGVCARWSVDSVYSYELAPLQQRAKMFAVEAMHATRGYRVPEPVSLLRRSCRPNELFYVLAGERLSEVVAQLPDA